MASVSTIDISGGAFQDSKGNPLAGGTLRLQLNNAAVVTNSGQIANRLPVIIQLDANGNAPDTAIWFNDVLSPAGTSYIADLFTASGAKCWASSQLWSFTGGDPINLKTMIPTNASDLVFYVPSEIGPTGEQGPQGIQGIPGPVGPYVISLFQQSDVVAADGNLTPPSGPMNLSAATGNQASLTGGLGGSIIIDASGTPGFTLSDGAGQSIYAGDLDFQLRADPTSGSLLLSAHDIAISGDLIEFSGAVTGIDNTMVGADVAGAADAALVTAEAYTDSRIAAIPAAHDYSPDITAAVLTESTRATTVEGSLATSSSLSAEVTARISGDATTLASAKTYADADIATEVTNRNTAIGVETTNRTTADTTLQTNITSEASTRATADTTNATAISTEATARATADGLLLPLAGGTMSGAIRMTSGTAINWNADSGISRLGAASLAIGNGTAGDFTGTLKCGTINMETAAGPVLTLTRTSFANLQLLASSTHCDITSSGILNLISSGNLTFNNMVVDTNGRATIGATAKAYVSLNGTNLQVGARDIYSITYLDNAGGGTIVGAVDKVGNVLVGGVDASISRLGAASLALGNGTAGDFTGSLKLGALSQVNGTAATGSGTAITLVTSGVAHRAVSSGQKTLTTTGATLLVAFLCSDMAAGNPPTIADSLGNTWTYLPFYGLAAGTVPRVRIAYAYANGGGALSTGSDTFTVTGTFGFAIIYAFAGTLTTSAVYAGVQNGNNGLIGTYYTTLQDVCNTVVPSGGDLVVGGWGSNSTLASATVAATSGDTISSPLLQTSGSDETGGAAYILNANGLPVNMIFTPNINNTSPVPAAVACFKAATPPVVTQPSPVLTLSGTYWNGASATDTWTLQETSASSSNGQSVLRIAHSGTSGQAAVQVPQLNLSNDTGFSRVSQGIIAAGNGVQGDVSGTLQAGILQAQITAGGIFNLSTGITPTIGWTGKGTGFVYDYPNVTVVLDDGAGVATGTAMASFGSTYLALGSNVSLEWSSGGVRSNGDTGISRLGAASLAIGNGTAGDFTGSLSLQTLSFPSGTSANQLIKWDGLTASSGFAGLEWGVSGSWASRLRVAPAGGTLGGRACNLGDLVYFNTSSGSEVFAWKVGIGGSMSLAGALAANGMQLTNGSASNYVSSFVASGGFTGGAIADAIAFNTFERDGNATPVRLSITGDTAASGAGIANVRLDNSRLMLAVNTGGIVWTDGVSETVADSGISRLGAASLAIGNGTAGDKTGSLTLAKLILSATSSPASNAAGTAGQLAYDANYIYVCQSSGVWTRAALTGGY